MAPFCLHSTRAVNSYLWGCKGIAGEEFTPLNLFLEMWLARLGHLSLKLSFISSSVFHETFWAFAVCRKAALQIRLDHLIPPTTMLLCSRMTPGCDLNVRLTPAVGNRNLSIGFSRSRIVLLITSWHRWHHTVASQEKKTEILQC